MSNPTAPQTLFYGCWKSSGHYFFNRNGKTVNTSMLKEWGYPNEHEVDGSTLLLPHPQEVLVGCRTYLPALHLTILSWWNRVYDSRPGVNSHFMMKGRAGLDMMWDTFQEQYAIAKDHTRPNIVERY